MYSSRPPTLPTSPVTSGQPAPRSRTMTSDSRPSDSPSRAVSGRFSNPDRFRAGSSHVCGCILLPCHAAVDCRCSSVWKSIAGDMKAGSKVNRAGIGRRGRPMAIRKAPDVLTGQAPVPETFGYTLKNRLLGRPLVNDQLSEQRLSKPLALGVLSPDGISSSAYGPEEILIALLQRAGIAAFALLLPMTLAILFVMTLVVMSYREVVMVYIRPGGSYVVARENFGPRIAQIAAVALLIDYV